MESQYFCNPRAEAFFNFDKLVSCLGNSGGMYRKMPRNFSQRFFPPQILSIKTFTNNSVLHF